MLENQNKKLNNKVNYLTKKNIDLNQTNVGLNNQLAKVSNEEVKRNQTYQTLTVISREGAALKTTFSAISKGLSTINTGKVQSKIKEKEENRVLEENINTLLNQLELIKALMDQINLNFDLANQNKELVLNNINLTNQLNQQIINNTKLLLENQNLIKEKISLNDELIEESNKKKRLELKIKELEAELENENKKQNQTLINNDCGDDKKIIDELNKKLIEEIENIIFLLFFLSNFNFIYCFFNL